MPALSENDDKFKEKQLQSAWNNTEPGTQIRTADNRIMTVIHPGTWNFEQGPDFKNAKIIIGGNEITGDIEVHCSPSDWYAHKHHTDANYNRVILHVTGPADKNEADKNRLPGIPSVIINPDMISEFPLTESEKFPNGRCVDFFSSCNDNSLHDFFVKAGKARFEEKSRAIMAEMIGSGTEKTCLKLMFEACGYKKNRESFIELFNRYWEYDDTCSSARAEAILWGESGFLPDPASSELDTGMKTFVKKIWTIWWETRVEARKEIKWVKAGVRPLNMPERRIAAISVMLGLFSNSPLAFLSGKTGNGISEKEFSRFLSDEIKCSHEIWDNYINFFSRTSKPSSVLGRSRMIDLSANVLMPSLHAYAAINRNNRLKDFSFDTWMHLPLPQMNRVVRIAAHKWFMPPQRLKKIIMDSASFQGAMYVFKNHCEKCHGDCDCCIVGKPVTGQSNIEQPNIECRSMIINNR
jgi:hypothetical protein